MSCKRLLDYLVRLEKLGHDLDKLDMIYWDGHDNHDINRFGIDNINQSEIVFSCRTISKHDLIMDYILPNESREGLLKHINGVLEYDIDYLHEIAKSNGLSILK